MNLLLFNQVLIVLGFSLVIFSYIFLGLSIKKSIKDRKKYYRFMYIAAFFTALTVLAVLYSIIFLTPTVSKLEQRGDVMGYLLFYRAAYIYSFFAIASTTAFLTLYRVFNIRISQQYKKLSKEL